MPSISDYQCSTSGVSILKPLCANFKTTVLLFCLGTSLKSREPQQFGNACNFYVTFLIFLHVSESKDRDIHVEDSCLCFTEFYETKQLHFYGNQLIQQFILAWLLMVQ